MKEEHRLQVLLAAIANPNVADVYAYADIYAYADDVQLYRVKNIITFVDAIEKYDDLHVLQNERVIVENTFEAIRDALAKGRDGLRDILPAVMTFKAIVSLSAQSSLSIHLQAGFMSMLKNINGPAALTEADAKVFETGFKAVLPKYDEEIAKLKRALTPIPLPPPAK